MHESDISFFAPEYQQILGKTALQSLFVSATLLFIVLPLTNDLLNELDDAENLQAEYKKQPCHLERLYGILH